MNAPLPLKQWLSPARPDETPIAWGDKQRWTLGQLRRDVARLQAWLRQQNAQRWALCFDNSYLFIVALLATLGAGKTPVIPGHRRLALLEEQQALFEGLLSDEPMSWQGPFHCVTSSDAASPPPWRQRLSLIARPLNSLLLVQRASPGASSKASPRWIEKPGCWPLVSPGGFTTVGWSRR